MELKKKRGRSIGSKNKEIIHVKKPPKVNSRGVSISIQYSDEVSYIPYIDLIKVNATIRRIPSCYPEDGPSDNPFRHHGRVQIVRKGDPNYMKRGEIFNIVHDSRNEYLKELGSEEQEMIYRIIVDGNPSTCLYLASELIPYHEEF